MEVIVGDIKLLVMVMAMVKVKKKIVVIVGGVVILKISKREGTYLAL